MEILTPRYSKEEFARRGDDLYECSIRPQIKMKNKKAIMLKSVQLQPD